MQRSVTLLRAQSVLRCSVAHIYKPMVSKVPDLKPKKKPEEVIFPERRELRQFPRMPYCEDPKGHKKVTKNIFQEMRGPEEVHTTLLHKKFGIRALAPGRMHVGHYEMCRIGINKKIRTKEAFAIWRIEGPWKPITKKGVGKRMGGGKGSIDDFVYPIKEGRIILEVGGDIDYQEAYPMLSIVAEKLPFKAEVVSEQEMAEKEEAARLVAEQNINPFTLEYCYRHNFLGCYRWCSPYDVLFEGKYR